MKPCPHFLKRFAVLAAASLILSAVHFKCQCRSSSRKV